MTFPETIPELLESCARTVEGPWLRFESDTWSLPDVLSEVDRFAVGLAERGVKEGDAVAILLGNKPETLFAWFAANRLGASAMPLNPVYKKPEVDAICAKVSPRVLVDETFTAKGSGAPRAAVKPEDVAVLIATSGTTGAPKIVMQTHRTYTLTAEAFPWWMGLTSADRLYCTLPLFHINAQAYSTMGALGAGAGLVLNAKFSASRFWDDLKKHGATEVNAVGAMIHILLQGPDRKDHGVRLVYSALALPEEQHRAFEQRFGVRMVVGYGLSETTFGTAWGGDGQPAAEPRYGTMGVLRQHPTRGIINHARVVTDANVDAADGEPGEMWLSNPALMKGYLDDPAQTSAVLGADGWFRTGDIVKRTGPDYTFISRKKDVLRRRGENVAASEIEGTLMQHPEIKEAAVIGVPSKLGEDEIVAFVIAPSDLDLENVRTFLAERLADFKIPSRFHVVDSLPRTPTERVAKHLLREI